MRVLFAVALGINFCVTPLLAQARVSPEEYAIYGVVLRSFYRRSAMQSQQGPVFVILSETATGNGSLPDELRMKGLTRSFLRRNRYTAHLEAKFPIRHKLSIVSKLELDQLIDMGARDAAVTTERYKAGKIRIFAPSCGSEWKYFNEKFSDEAPGYYQFSRIGFSKDHKFALVSFNGEGGCWKSWDVYVLKRDKRGWTIYSAGGSFEIS
jgi:hypothetical protein